MSNHSLHAKMLAINFLPDAFSAKLVDSLTQILGIHTNRFSSAISFMPLKIMPVTGEENSYRSTGINGIKCSYTVGDPKDKFIEVDL